MGRDARTIEETTFRQPVERGLLRGAMNKTSLTHPLQIAAIHGDADARRKIEGEIDRMPKRKKSN